MTTSAFMSTLVEGGFFPVETITRRQITRRQKKAKKGTASKDKRKGLSRLPDDWREQMIYAASDLDEFRLPLIVTALTGLRPAELVMGARMVVLDGNIQFTIKCAKSRSGKRAKESSDAAPPERVITVKSAGEITVDLYEWLAAMGGDYTVIIDSTNRFSKYVKRLCARLFPGIDYVITPYSFRHQFAADSKSQRISAEELGKRLGHTSTRSARAYGVAGQGRKPVSKVIGVAASRPVHTPPKDEKKPWEKIENTQKYKDTEVEYVDNNYLLMSPGLVR